MFFQLTESYLCLCEWILFYFQDLNATYIIVFNCYMLDVGIVSLSPYRKVLHTYIRIQFILCIVTKIVLISNDDFN